MTPILVFNDIEYRFDILVQKGRTCPLIEVEEKQLASFNFEKEAFDTESFVSFKNADVIKNQPILFYKYNGKIVVLAGEATLHSVKALGTYDGKIKGHLVSSIVLKSTKIPDAMERQILGTPVYPVRSSSSSRSFSKNRF